MQSVDSKPPYAVLSMFDGCGSSVDILTEKFGYRLKVCLLCKRDETLRVGIFCQLLNPADCLIDIF